MNKRALVATVVVAFAVVVLWPGDDDTSRSKDSTTGKPERHQSTRSTPRDSNRRQGAPWYPQPPDRPPATYGRRVEDGYRFRSDQAGTPPASPYAYQGQPRFRFRPEQPSASQPKRFSGNYAPRPEPYGSEYDYDTAAVPWWSYGADPLDTPRGTSGAPGYGGYSGGSTAGSRDTSSAQPWSSPYAEPAPTYPGEGQSYGMTPSRPWETPVYRPPPSSTWDERNGGPLPAPLYQAPEYGPSQSRPWQDPAYSPLPAPAQPWETPDYGNPPPYSGGPDEALYSVR